MAALDLHGAGKAGKGTGANAEHLRSDHRKAWLQVHVHYDVHPSDQKCSSCVVEDGASRKGLTCGMLCSGPERTMN